MLAMLLSGVLAGCAIVPNPSTGDDDTEVENSVDDTENTENDTEADVDTENEPEVNELDYEEIYQDVLDKMHRIIAHPESSAWDADDASIIIQEAASYQEDPIDNIGYAFMDLNGDGVCELVIGNVQNNYYPGNTLHVVYTYLDGEVVYSFGGPSRNPHFLMEDGRILFSASNGYYSYGFGLSTWNAGSDTLTCEEIVYTGIGPDGETQVVFKNNIGYWDEDDAYLTDMTLDDYENEWESYAANTKYVELVPFSQYSHADGYAGVEGIEPVYVSYADESSLSDCEQYILDDNDYSSWVSFYANMQVQHFYVMEMYDMEFNDDGTFNYFTEEKVEYDILNQGTEVAVKMNLPETLPQYSFSYYEADGTYHCYALFLSGEDGSVSLMDLSNQSDD